MPDRLLFKMILKHTHNALVIFILTIFLFSCSKSDEDFVEKCADIKTTSYWNSRAIEFAKEIGELKEELKATTDKYEKSAIKDAIKDKKYHNDLYLNAAKKSLGAKLYEFPLYEENFKICENRFKKNPESFKRLYK